VDFIKRVYVPKEERFYADMDNKRPFDKDIVSLTQTDEGSIMAFERDGNQNRGYRYERK
jgi:hypothetical protein